MARNVEVTKDYGAGGVALAGCLIGGIGVAWLFSFNYVLQGAIIGLGVGLVVMALLSRNS